MEQMQSSLQNELPKLLRGTTYFFLEISQHTGTSSVGHNAGMLLQFLLLLATSVSVTMVDFLKPQSFQIPSHL